MGWPLARLHLHPCRLSTIRTTETAWGDPRLERGPAGWGPGEEPQESGPSEPPLNPAQNGVDMPCALWALAWEQNSGNPSGTRGVSGLHRPGAAPADLTSRPQGEGVQCVPGGLCQAAPNKGAFGVPGAGVPACGRGEGTGCSGASSPRGSAPATLQARAARARSSSRPRGPRPDLSLWLGTDPPRKMPGGTCRSTVPLGGRHPVPDGDPQVWPQLWGAQGSSPEQAKWAAPRGA